MHTQANKQLVLDAFDTLFNKRDYVAAGDYVMLHERFFGHGLPRAWILVDVVRIEDGRLAGH